MRSREKGKNRGEARQVPRPVCLCHLLVFASIGVLDPNVRIVCAGTPQAQHAPGGLRFILDHRQKQTESLGVTGGLTLVSSASAFQQPSFATTTKAKRDGHQVQHFAQVQPAASADVTHPSYYLAPGDHERPGTTTRIGGKIYTAYWHITRQISALMEQGEQEHLEDAQRAYELTYKLIVDTINAMVGQQFGPAKTPYAATQLAEAELARRLPSELGVDPKNWVAVLDRLLSATKARDTNGWHSVYYPPPRTVGNKIIYTITAAATTKIGEVLSSGVVNY